MKYLFIILSLLLFTLSRSQNLVPNPSFEVYTLCPNNGGQIDYATPWTAATTDVSSTDYINGCSSTIGVPYHSGGFQYARTGNAFAGLIFCAGSGIREYLQVQLSNSLTQNTSYYVEFYVNSANFNWSSFSNNVAANFSIIRPYTSTEGVLQPLIAHIMNSGNPTINDTLNWVKVSGCYTAQGGEEYLTIGNFFDNANTQVGATGAAYYYVDDVLVEEITGSCTTGINELSINEVKLFPNPVENSLHIAASDLKNKEALTIKLHDVLGKEVLSAVYKEELDLSGLEKGIYFLSLYQDNQLLVTKKVVKE